MGIRHYLAGIATPLIIGGGIFWFSQTDKISEERCIYTIERQGELKDIKSERIEKIKIIEENRKWNPSDTYRIEILNKNGEVIFYVKGLTKEPRLEQRAEQP